MHRYPDDDDTPKHPALLVADKSGNSMRRFAETEHAPCKLFIQQVVVEGVGNLTDAVLNCGSCWAHSAADVVGAAIAIFANQPNQTLSVQQQLDCNALSNYVYGVNIGHVDPNDKT